ncbi:MAG: hypothetical protein KAH16_03030, partial [Candidatus Izimaplasma sp.]|nr:hypothetical protein [Candidatus Izimaplasma bacterium]
ISHTLISNFEKGHITPHSDTIKDIFRILKLQFYDEEEVSVKFKALYQKAFYYIYFHDYVEAEKVIKEIKKDQIIYKNSIEVINFAIIISLYYTISNVYFEPAEGYLDQYEIVLDFFTPDQRQLYFFIKGLEYINKEEFSQARIYFEKALKIGDTKLDVLIKDYYVIALSKSNDFVEARKYSLDVIKEFESQTNYVRAMRLRTRIAYDLSRTKKYEESEKMYKQVLDYSIKYGVRTLENRCNCRLALSAIIKGDKKKAEEYIIKVDPYYNRLYHYIKLDIASYKRNDEEFLKIYNEYMALEWVKKSEKTTLFFECMYMRYKAEFMNKQKYESNLKRLIKLGHMADDGEMIEISSNMLAAFYKKERKYKLGFNVTQQHLHYLTNGVKDTEYDTKRIIKVYDDTN